MLGSGRVLVSVAVAVVCVGVAAGTVVAHETAGDPRPVAISPADRERLDAAPVAPMEKMFRFRGADIATDEAARRDLACIERGGQTTCYASEAEMERVEHLASRAERTALARASSKQQLRASAKKQRGALRTRAASHGGNPMSIWEHADYHGWRIDTSTSCVWHNLPGDYNDEASSVDTGNHTGILALDTGGGSHHLQFQAYAGVPHLSGYFFLRCGPDGTCVPFSWNDEASSRQRRGC